MVSFIRIVVSFLFGWLVMPAASIVFGIRYMKPIIVLRALMSGPYLLIPLVASYFYFGVVVGILATAILFIGGSFLNFKLLCNEINFTENQEEKYVRFVSKIQNIMYKISFGKEDFDDLEGTYKELHSKTNTNPEEYNPLKTDADGSVGDFKDDAFEAYK